MTAAAVCPGHGRELPSPGCRCWRRTVANGYGSRSSCRKGTPVCAAARGPVCAAADTAPRLDSPRRALGCQATFLAPRRRGNALEQMLRLAFTDPPPRGRTRKAPAPLRSARATASCHPPSPSRGGFAARCAPGCRSIGLLLAGLCAAAPAGQSARETPGCLPPPGGTCALHDPGSADAALPVAAALCFLLPRQRNVMRRSLLRQGRASRCSVPAAALTPAPSALAPRRKEEEQHKCRSNRPLRGQGRSA